MHVPVQNDTGSASKIPIRRPPALPAVTHGAGWAVVSNPASCNPALLSSGSKARLRKLGRQGGLVSGSPLGSISSSSCNAKPDSPRHLIRQLSRASPSAAVEERGTPARLTTPSKIPIRSPPAAAEFSPVVATPPDDINTVIPGYDRLTVKALTVKLKALGAPALAAVRVHEAENKGRVTLLKVLDKLLAELGEERETP